MKCLVVYESMFGNTHEIATAIGQGLSHVGEVHVRAVGDVNANEVVDLDLLVVGGPTHVHGMTRETSRRAAVDEAANDAAIELDESAPGPGLREWLESLGKESTGSCAAFDTRIDKPVFIAGSAAKGISKRLKRHGFDLAVEPESFFVEDSAGPLRDGEVDRARKWGAVVAHELGRLHRHKQGTR